MRLVADNLHILSPAIQSALLQKNPAPIQALVRRVAAAGAEAIDINPGPLSRDAEAAMRFLVSVVRQVADLPLVIDTANPVAMEAGLRMDPGRSTLNGLSLEPEKLDRMLALAKTCRTDVIGYLLRPDHTVPDTVSERLSIAVALLGHVTAAGIEPRRLIIDPVIVPLLWEDGKKRNKEALEVIRALPEVLDYPVRTIAGLSNLTSGKGPVNEKRAVESAYAAMLSGAGLSMVLMNMEHETVVRAVKACRMIGDDGPFAWGQM